MSQIRLRSAFVLAALFASAGCSQGVIEGGSRGSDSSAAVGFSLQISPGGTVSNATYTISGPNGFESAGSVSVGDSADVPVTVSHLPLGTGYEMNVSAIASDGVTACDGSATFDVIDAITSTVVVHLVCAVPSGDVNLSGTVNICPLIDSLGASPNQARLGGAIALTSAAHDSDNGPQPLSYTWSVNGARLKQAAPNWSFICTSVGDVTLTETASDGDSNPTCPDSLTVNVRCTE